MTPFENKKISKTIIFSRFKHVFICTAAYLAVTYLMNLLLYKLYGYDAYIEKIYQMAIRGVVEEMPVLATPPATALLLAALINLMIFTLKTGFTCTMLRISRGEEPSVKALLDGFEFFFKAIFITLLTGAAVFVGLFLLIVPGIIIAYRYSLAIYVMFDNPDKSVFWCMRESGRLMCGHKFRLFSLQFSFWPLILLGAIISIVLLPVVEMWRLPYMSVATAVFYNERLGMSIIEEKMKEEANGTGE